MSHSCLVEKMRIYYGATAYSTPRLKFTLVSEDAPAVSGTSVTKKFFGRHFGRCPKVAVTRCCAPYDTGLPIVKTGEGDQEMHAEEDETCECSNSKVLKLAPQIPDNSRLPDAAAIQNQWPSQEAVSDESMSTLLCSLESAMAPTQPTSMPVNLPPAYSHLCLSRALGFRPCWKPPDSGPSVAKHSHLHRTVLMLSTALPAALGDWVESLRDQNIELGW